MPAPPPVPLLQRLAQAGEGAPEARRAVLQTILQDPQRALDESFDQLAQRSGRSVPTILRACRALGFNGLRAFKIALAQELARDASPLPRRVRMEDSVQEVVDKVSRSAAATLGGLRHQFNAARLAEVATALAGARQVDLLGVGHTSWFMAHELQSRLFRLGLPCNAWSDYHLQQVAAAAQHDGGVLVAISHVGGMPTLLDAVAMARRQGARVVALTRPDTPLAAAADWALTLAVPQDAVMHVGLEAYLAQLTMIEVLTVLVAQRLGEPALQRLRHVRQSLARHGVDMRPDPLQGFGEGGAA